MECSAAQHAGVRLDGQQGVTLALMASRWDLDMTVSVVGGILAPLSTSVDDSSLQNS